jgi:DNA-binding MarR family transcriptional regulator
MGKKAKARRKVRSGLDRRASHPAEPVGQAADAPAGRRSSAELAADLFSLAGLLRRRFARTRGDDGLTRARLSALAVLVLGGPRTLGRLAADEGVRPPTMTRLVRAMEVDGLVVRERHPSDGRSIVVRATPAGEAELERGRAARMGPLAEAIDQLDPADRYILEQASDLLGPLLRASVDARGRPDA